MSQALNLYTPNIEDLITEDDEPVDNIPSEKQQRLLTRTLYTSWKDVEGKRKFLACANVGIFYQAKNPPVVPDIFLSLDVEVAEDWWAKEHRSYFIWEFGKPPEVALEIVSNQVGEEAGEKMRKYARMKVEYYVIFDPDKFLSKNVLTIYKLHGFRYRKQLSHKLETIGLGLILWEGEFEGVKRAWLRWVDEAGNLLLTGEERAKLERAEKEKERAEKEAALLKAEEALQKAERLAARLRELGKDPDKI
ncbi:MAG: Uma2 family endonuclease [Acidobacteriota bacterium]